MTNVDRNLGVSEPWGRSVEQELEELRARLRALEGGQKVSDKNQSILADLQAKTSVEAQLLQSQLDFHEVVTYSDEPPSMGIDEADPGGVEDDDDPITGDELDTDPGVDEGDVPDPDDAGIPWEADDGAPPEPVRRWVQEDPLTGVKSGEWVFVDGAWEPVRIGGDAIADDAISYGKLDPTVVQDVTNAKSDAEQALVDILGVQGTAGQAAMDARDAWNEALAARDRASSENLYPDPSFEGGGVGLVPNARWRIIEVLDAHHGAHVLEVVGTGAGSRGEMSTPLPTEEGRVYACSMWVRRTDASQTATLGIQHRKEFDGSPRTTGYVISVSASTLPLDEWVLLERDYLVPSGVIRIGFNPYTAAGNTGVQFDSVAVRDVTEQRALEQAAQDALIAAGVAVDRANLSVKETEIQWAVSASNSTAPGGGWSTSQPSPSAGQYVWMRTRVTYGDNSTSVTAAAMVTGNTGEPGTPGSTGVGVDSTAVRYQAGSSPTTAPTGTWASTLPPVNPGDYLWTRTVITYTDSTTTTAYSVGRQGADGAGINIAGTAATYGALPGGLGPGDAGEAYLVSADGLLYIWDGTQFPANGAGVAFKGDPGARGDDGVGVSAVTVRYAKAASGTTAPASGWGTTIPATSEGEYLWTRTVVDYTDSSSSTAYSVARHGVTGAPGAPGAPGDNGISVVSVTPFYLNGATKPSLPSGASPGGSWSDTQPAPVVGQSLWQSFRITYSNSTYQYTPVTLVEAFTFARDALDTATRAQETADGKNTIFQSTSTPVGSGETEGDTWWQYSDGTHTLLVAQWTWSGSAWQKSTIDSEIIAALTVDKLVVTGGAKIPQAVINTLVGDEAFIRELAAERVVVTGTNLIEETQFRMWVRTPGSSTAPVEAPVPFPRGDKAIMAAAGSAATYAAYLGTRPNNVHLQIPVEQGAEYVGSVWVYSPTAIPTGGVAISSYRYSGWGETGSATDSVGQGYNPEPIPANTWVPFTADLPLTGNTVSFGVRLLKTATHTDEVYFAAPSVVRKVGGVLIEDDAITAPKIAANTIETIHLKADAITSPKIGAGEVRAGHLDVIAEDNNRRLSIQPDGIRLWGNVEAGGDPNISITTEGVEYFSISDNEGNTLSSMDEEGNVTGQTLTANEDMVLGGESMTEWMDAQPKGVIAFGSQDVGGRTVTANGSQRGQLAFLELEADLVEGRAYSIEMDQITVKIPENTRVSATVWRTLDDTQPDFNSLILARFEYLHSPASGGDTMLAIGGTQLLFPSATQTYRMLFGLEFRATGSAVKTLTVDSTYNSTSRCRVAIVDQGLLTVEETGVDRTLKAGPGGSDAGSGDGAPKKTYTKTYNSTSGYTFDPRNNNKITSFTYANNVAQGGGSLGPYGELYGGWFFGNAWASDISGAEVTKVELYLTNLHAYSNAGLTAMIHSHTSTATDPTSMARSALTSRTSAQFGKGVGKWVDITSTMKTLMGTVKGFGINTSGNANYGYFSQSAKVRITYKK